MLQFQFGKGHGISIGSEMSGNVTNVILRNLSVRGKMQLCVWMYCQFCVKTLSVLCVCVCVCVCVCGVLIFTFSFFSNVTHCFGFRPTAQTWAFESSLKLVEEVCSEMWIDEYLFNKNTLRHKIELPFFFKCIIFLFLLLFVLFVICVFAFLIFPPLSFSFNLWPQKFRNDLQHHIHAVHS